MGHPKLGFPIPVWMPQLICEGFRTRAKKKAAIGNAASRSLAMKSSETVLRVAALSTAFMAGAAASHIYHTRGEPSPEPPSEYPGATLLAGVELGGTTCRAAVASLNDPATLSAVIEVPTRDPLSTMNKLVEFLRSLIPFASIGIASFGPLDLDPKSATYGYITTTPKPGWQNINLLGFFAEFPVPIGLDTDVNAPALAELRYGGRKGDSCAYVTVGTGIGVGIVVNGQPIHGLVHPEGGHIMPLRKEGDKYEGWSDIHKLSVESMASAKACADRAGVEMKDLASMSDDHAVWDDVAYYLAQLCISICYMVSPHVIILSGGVMKRNILFDKVRKTFGELNEGYICHEQVVDHLEEYIVPSTYGNDIGIIGAIELARRVLDQDG